MGEVDEPLVEDGGPDAWAAHLPGRESVPAYLVSKFAAQYRVIVDVLLAQQDASLTGLSHDALAAGIRTHLLDVLPEETAEALLAEDRFPLESRLHALEQWQVVTRWQEPAQGIADFLRRRDRYQLTPTAARLHAFWSEATTADEDAAGDLTLAPRAILDRLTAFQQALTDRRYGAAAAEFQQISAVHRAMAQAARRWQRTLAHALAGSPDPQKQELLWRTLHAYVGMWGEQVDVHSPRIAETITAVDTVLTPQLWAACARSSLTDDAADDLIAVQAERWATTWAALRTWFGGQDSQARRLRRQLRDLVAPWARNMHILMDTGGTVSRRAELLRLAAAIERAPDDTEAWRLWDTAVGVFRARHLMLPAEAPHDQALPWAEAPPAPVTARFREHGTHAAVGRRAKTADYSAGRRAARGARTAALALRRDAEARLRSRSGSRLSTWGTLSDHELDLLLDLVGTARRGRADERSGGAHSAVTGDGAWRVTLHPPEAAGGGVAVLTSPRGTLTTPDWLFEMERA